MSIYILAIDTTSDACSAALMFNDQLLLERSIIAPREHTQHILPMIESLLTEAKITLNDISALAFSKGPGSFTGVRINISIAHGIALGINLPLIGISALATLAEGALRQTGVCRVLTAIDARMGELYWAMYQLQSSIWLSDKSESIMTPGTITSVCKNLTGIWATAGNGWTTYPGLLSKHNNLQLISSKIISPNARDMLPIALHQYHQNKGNYSIALAQPTYLTNKLMYKKLSSRN